MGEISNYMLNGLMCEQCGTWMPDVWPDDAEKPDEELMNNPPGYPRVCADCKGED